jgi:hypothetical protein
VLESGNAKALVVAKLERLSQALLDLANLMATAQKQGWAVVALDCALDPTAKAVEVTLWPRRSLRTATGGGQVVGREVLRPRPWLCVEGSCESAGGALLSCHFQPAEVAGEGGVRDLVVASERAECLSGCAAED